MNLDNLYLYSYSDKEKIDLSGTYCKESLIKIMIDKWISYMECHKCGKSDYCKYTEPHGANPNKKAEIKCGVARDFIINFVNTTFNLVKDLDNTQKQAYLNAAYYFTEYVQSAEINIGTFINKDYLSGWGSYAPTLYGFSKQTLDYLNKSHREMKHIDIFNSKKNVILVEGFSEKIFVENFTDLEVINYEGKGRIDFSKIEFLVKEYHDKGYEVYLQSDLDGKNENQKINRIIKEGLIKEENIFQFKHDFETAIPPKLFYNILQDNELIEDDFEDFKKNANLSQGIVKHVKNKYGVDVNKRMVATEISLMIHKLKYRKNLYEDQDFLNTEIGKFWNFVSRIV